MVPEASAQIACVPVLFCEVLGHRLSFLIVLPMAIQGSLTVSRLGAPTLCSSQRPLVAAV